MTDHGHNHSHSGGPGQPEQVEYSTPTEFWEQRYADADRIWSGRVNRTLAEVAGGWAPGRSLDLGCGEGGDVLWFAEHGWVAIGIDLSLTAVARAQTEAATRGLAGARFIAADLQEWIELGPTLDGVLDGFDLITASFMQSPVELPRQRILQAALTRLAVGGRLVIVSHAAAPPWAKSHPGEFLSPEGELGLLGLDLESGEWAVELAEVRKREAAGPDGHEHHLDDTVVVVSRNG